jgi:hypothetical protein
MAQPTTARPGISFLAGIATFLVVGVVALIVRSTLSSGPTYDPKRAEARLAKLAALRKEEQAKLSTYGWVDKTKGTVHLPIERAFELIVGQLRSQEPAPSTVKAEANTTNLVPPYLQPAAPAASPAAAAPSVK